MIFPDETTILISTTEKVYSGDMVVAVTRDDRDFIGIYKIEGNNVVIRDFRDHQVLCFEHKNIHNMIRWIFPIISMKLECLHQKH